MTLDAEGSLDVQLCSSDKTSCKSVASYKNYLNDQAGDGGWSGCKAVQNPTTTCKYAVTNIKIESNSNAPVFSDPNSKCHVLNAEASLTTSKRSAMSQASQEPQASQMSQ